MTTSAQKAAIVTGASYGLGLAIAERLARDGFDIVATDLSADTMAETVAAVEAHGRRCLPLPLDLKAQETIEHVVDQANRWHGAVDVLVNNAGAASPRKPALELTRAEWAGVIDVSLTGTFFMTQAFAAGVIRRERPASVVMISSTHGVVGFANQSAYGVAKAGVAHLARVLALEWAEEGVRVNAVAPGTTETPSRRKALSDPALRERMMGRIPLGRFAQPSDIAGAVSYLAGPDAAYVTGHTILVDGGVTAA